MTLSPIRLGMVGGGPGSFIGPIHKMAAELDGRFRLVAGAFSRDAARSRETGLSYGLAADRAYPDYATMIAAEATGPDGIEALAIVTPNHMHLPVAVAALEAGLHVISDKPATATLREAEQLGAVIAAHSLVYALTYTYTGYAMIRQARAMVASGEIGTFRKLVVTYPQGWLAEAVERQGSKQAEWRADPRKAGVGGAVGDIGVHAFNLAEYVSGTRVVSFVADLSSLVDGRTLDDDCNVLLRFEGGQPGVLIASQVATGDGNCLSISVYGDRAGFHWRHERPDLLTVNHVDGRSERLHAGSPGLVGSRLPVGHPEGFIEAFATIYSDTARAIRGESALIDNVVPGIGAGIRSMLFVERVVAASRARAGWTAMEGDA